MYGLARVISIGVREGLVLLGEQFCGIGTLTDAGESGRRPVLVTRRDREHDESAKHCTCHVGGSPAGRYAVG